MPPFFPQGPLDAGATGTPRWLAVVVAVIGAASEPWVLGLVALAYYSWLERRVRGVLAAVAPLWAALAVSGALVVAARAAWATPRAAAGGDGLAPVLHGLLPGAQVVALATFAAYSLLAYGRRGLPAVALLVAGAAVRLQGSARLGPDLWGGVAAGAVLGGLAWASAVRLWPAGHLAQLRSGRRAPARSP